MSPETAGTIRVLIADESARITGNVVRRLEAEADIQVAAVVHDGDAAVQEALRTRPDVAVVDAGLPGLDGPQTTEMLSQYLPRTGVIMLSLNAENEAYRRAMLAGAREFLQKPFTGDELVAAIRRVHALELRKATPPAKETPNERRGQVYTVFAGKGGVGKTAVAVNLAVSLARHLRVVLLDCSLQFGDVAALLNITPERTIADLAAGDAVADSEVVQQVLVPGPGGITVLTAPTSPELADYVTTQHLRALVDELRRGFDCIVIDTASHLGEIGLDAVELADRVLLVTDLSVTAVKNTKLVRSVMEVLKVDPERFILVLNHREAAGEMDRAHAEQFVDLEATAEIPYDAGVVAVSVSRGVPFVLAFPDSAPSARIEELARSLSTGFEAAAALSPAPEPAAGGRKPRRLLGLGRR
jgi:pilus assembly protein CpaE